MSGDTTLSSLTSGEPRDEATEPVAPVFPLAASTSAFCLDPATGLFLLESPVAAGGAITVVGSGEARSQLPVQFQLTFGTLEQHVNRFRAQLVEMQRQLFGAVPGGDERRRNTTQTLLTAFPAYTVDMREALALPSLQEIPGAQASRPSDVAPPAAETPEPPPLNLLRIASDDSGQDPDQGEDEDEVCLTYQIDLVDALLARLPGLRKFEAVEPAPGEHDDNFNLARTTILELTSPVGLLKVARFFLERLPDKKESGTWYGTELVNNSDLFLFETGLRRGLTGRKTERRRLARFSCICKGWAPLDTSDEARDALGALVGPEFVLDSDLV